jgi:hypothetical protein
MRVTLSHYTLLFSKNEFEELLWLLALGTKNPRGRLVLVVRPSTLIGRGEKITHIFSLCFIGMEFVILAVEFYCLWLSSHSDGGIYHFIVEFA